MRLLTTFKQHLVGTLVADPSFADSSPSRLLRELWGHGGPLSNLALKTVTRGGPHALAAGGLVSEALHALIEPIAIAFCPPPSQRDLARTAGFQTPPSLLSAIGGLPKKAARKAAMFAHSFVLHCTEDVWGDAACAPLVALLTTLRSAIAGGAENAAAAPPAAPDACAPDACAWMATWRPLLTHQHGDLNAANILVDVHDGLWLIDFAKSGHFCPFHDAAKMVSTLLFEYYPVPWSVDEVRATYVPPCAKGHALMTCPHVATLRKRARLDDLSSCR